VVQGDYGDEMELGKTGGDAERGESSWFIEMEGAYQG